MRKCLISIISLYVGFIQGVYAYPGGWIVGASFGGTAFNVGQSDGVSNGLNHPNSQYVTHHSDNQIDLGALIGYVAASGCQFFPYSTIGLSFTYGFPTGIRGQMQQPNAGKTLLYHFSYKVQRKTILAIFKTDFIQVKNVMPYGAIGIGYSYNLFNHYQDNPQPGFLLVPTPQFQSSTNIYGTYTFALGLDFIIQEKLMASLEYNFGNFRFARSWHAGNTKNANGFNFVNTHLQHKLLGSSIQLILNYALC